MRDAEVARAQSVQAAVDSTVAMLSYRPDNVTQNLAAALDRMTGGFRDSYASLTHDVVIPGAKQRQISAVATVPAAASVSATQTHAVVLLYVNQTTTIGNDPPTDSASTCESHAREGERPMAHLAIRPDLSAPTQPEGPRAANARGGGKGCCALDLLVASTRSDHVLVWSLEFNGHTPTAWRT